MVKGMVLYLSRYRFDSQLSYLLDVKYKNGSSGTSLNQGSSSAKKIRVGWLCIVDTMRIIPGTLVKLNTFKDNDIGCKDDDDDDDNDDDSNEKIVWIMNIEN